MSAAARARRVDRSLEIVVLEKGNTVSYSACGLPYFVSGEVRRLDDLIVHTPEFFERERNIEVRKGTEVIAIEHGRRRVVTKDGAAVSYDKLVIATGARQDTSEPVDIDAARVFRLQTIEDASRMSTFIAAHRPKTAVVAGAGYIGIEAAEALRTNGVRVRIIDSNPDVLGSEDEVLTALVKRHLAVFGVSLECGARVDRATAIGVDMVVLATGLKPNVELAVGAGIETGRTGAIRVDDRMETNFGGVFAAGDCAETLHRVTGRPAYVPLGTTANKMGRVAGANAAGARERFSGVVGTSIVRVFGLGIGVTGLSLRQARREAFDPVSARIESRDRAAYFRGRPVMVELVSDRSTRRLLGGTVTGEDGVAGRVNVIATALSAKMTVDDFVELDLAYAPPYAPVWDPVLTAARQLIKLMER
jgi:NADPH-dependent 2,4-dienoyl-CoA reductase/sulfur reductase-like enzyme